jgi:hypothetical protein
LKVEQEAVQSFIKGKHHTEVAELLLEHIRDLPRAFEFANSCDDPSIWRMVGKKQHEKYQENRQSGVAISLPLDLPQKIDLLDSLLMPEQPSTREKEEASNPFERTNELVDLATTEKIPTSDLFEIEEQKEPLNEAPLIDWS